MSCGIPCGDFKPAMTPDEAIDALEVHMRFRQPICGDIAEVIRGLVAKVERVSDYSRTLTERLLDNGMIETCADALRDTTVRWPLMECLNCGHTQTFARSKTACGYAVGECDKCGPRRNWILSARPGPGKATEVQPLGGARNKVVKP